MISKSASNVDNEAEDLFAASALWNRNELKKQVESKEKIVRKPPKSQKSVRKAQPRINVPNPVKRNFFVPGKHYQAVKETKERKKLVSTETE